MPPKKRVQINKTWFFLIEIVGLGLSIFLFLVSASLINIPCPRSHIFACTGIVRGTFGHLGPFSVAAMGVVYYLCQLMLTVGLRERAAQVLKGLLVLGGVLFIAWLRALELIYIKEICPWCWGVALVTLIHAGVAYTILAPPLPKLRPGGIIGLVAGGFIVAIGLVSLVELSLGIGKKLQQQSNAPEETHAPSKSNVPIATPATPKKQPTRKDDDAAAKENADNGRKKATPAPSPEPTATPKPTPLVEVGATPLPTPQPTLTPTPVPSPSPSPTAAPALTFDPEPKLEENEEVKILRRRGWRHAPSGNSVVKAVKIQPPVLMLAYDPHCPDCYRLITQTLDRDPMNGLRVTRIAIQESMLNGQINSWVKELPTMLLFGDDGTVLMKQVGSRITADELVKKINDALAKAKK